MFGKKYKQELQSMREKLQTVDSASRAVFDEVFNFAVDRVVYLLLVGAVLGLVVSDVVAALVLIFETIL